VLDPRASRRLRRITQALPAVLLTGLFMVVSGGVTASATPARELSTETYQEANGSSALTGVAEFAEPVAKTATLTPERDLAPPTPAGTVVHPLDLYPLQGLLSDADPLAAESALRSTEHSRGPPAPGQQ
jgi:hypothetical protein